MQSFYICLSSIFSVLFFVVLFLCFLFAFYFNIFLSYKNVLFFFNVFFCLVIFVCFILTFFLVFRLLDLMNDLFLSYLFIQQNKTFEKAGKSKRLKVLIIYP